LTVVYDGKKWTKVKSGYYICSVKSRTFKNWLHQYVYEKEAGKIPEGFHIHHKDRNKDNNLIENLILLSSEDHSKEHGEYKYSNPERYRKQCEHLNKIRPKHVWPEDPIKFEQHRKALKEGMKNSEQVERVCKNCGDQFMAKKFGRHIFCSNKCKSKHRRENKFDEEIRICTVCGKEFKANKYKEKSTCSRSCANVLRARTIRNANN